ncbi:MAG: U32 family peptidase [Candidatus Lokiarchaeota archaeon]|nr:U32 family peptidase [Candidatus Lokiarchaeota archaeon]
MTPLNKPELLAPVQNWNVLRSFSAKGLPDAIYFGIDDFNMRARAKNFKISDLQEIVNFCNNKIVSIKAYLATNILIYNSDLAELERIILEAKDANIDGIIVSDFAAIKIAMENHIPFHISTQMNISNIESARFFEGIGAQRIVLARELSLIQIRKIKNQLKRCDVECFVHGAMCTSISGRCYLSATICDSEHFSANRGRCVQPCRRNWRVIDDENHELVYDGQRFLSSKDLCMIEYLPQLINSGIDAFKIEGRMKDPVYVREVTSCYREAIESHFEGSFNRDKVKDWLKRLSQVFNRGFHTGFYFQKPTIENVQLLEEGNASPYKKKYVGKVISFNESSKTANILIENKNVPLTRGCEIILQSNDTFRFETVKKMFIGGEKIISVVRNDSDAPIKVNIRLCEKVNPEERIYILFKNEKTT